MFIITINIITNEMSQSVIEKKQQPFSLCLPLSLCLLSPHSLSMSLVPVFLILLYYIAVEISIYCLYHYYYVNVIHR